ncbi:MAG: bis(5'-nucleosyl)-tetraphosphatase (symmetrical) YqeK [Fusobacteriaceae bacterium]
MTELINKLKKDLKEKLSPARFSHVINVESMGQTLGAKFSVPKDKISVAAFIHDIMKEYPAEFLYKIFLESKQKFSEINGYENENNILHGFVGAIYAEKNYGITDEDILNAARYHTIGRKNMSDLEKIIYIADKIEQGRNYKFSSEIRDLALKNLDAGIILETEKKIEYLIKEKSDIHVNTLELRNYLLKGAK